MSDLYCVIGNPIGHSRSPDIHAAFAAQTGQDIAYERCLAPRDGFAATVRDLIARGYKGASVTLPFKLEAAALADSLSERGRAAGAVNTLFFVDGKIHADNTDGAGLVNDIVKNAGVPIAGQRILLPLLGEGPREIVIANRTRATADALVAEFAGVAGGRLSVCEFAEAEGAFDLVLNATSASLAASVPPIPARVFRPGTLALDLMYAAEPTPFMRFAAEHGATARDGLGMLVEQAVEAFAQWRGVRPDGKPVLALMRRTL